MTPVGLFIDVLWTILMPIFLLVCVGAALGRAFKPDMLTLGRLNLYAFVPALMFSKFVRAPLDAGEIGLIALYWVLLVCTMWGLAVLAARRLHVADDVRPTVALGAMFPNSGNFGIPAAELAFGPVGVATQGVVLAVENLSFFTLGMYVAGGGAARWRDGLRAVVRMPILYAIAAAFLFRSHPDLLPRPLDTALELLGQGLVPVALVTLGAQLAADGGSRPREAWLICTLRLAVAPVVAWMLVKALGFDGRLGPVLVAAAAYPVAVNSVLLAIEFKRHPGIASAAVFWSTLLSAVTVTAVIAFLR